MLHHSIRVLLIGTALALSACATSYAPQPLALPSALTDVQSADNAGVRVSVSMLSDAQARQHFGVDLSKRDVQVLWIGVRNPTDRQLWFIRNILDADFYSADEVALLTQGDVPRTQRDALRHRFRDASMRVALPPLSAIQGFVYLPRVEGGRYVDIRLQLDAYTEALRANSQIPADASAPPLPRELRFEFALTLPDGHFDYERLDAERTYAGRTLPTLSLQELRTQLQALPCCAANADNDDFGDPLNIVLVGDANQILHSLSRSGWSFTHRLDLGTLRREIGAAIAGDSYLVAPVSNLYVFGRKHDIAMQRARHTISRRNHLRLWLAPFRYDGRPVWVGQVSRDIGIKLTPKSPTLTTHIIDPQVDATREYLLHSLMAQGFVERFGFVGGSAAASPSAPRENLTGDPFFSDGLRLVVMLAPEPMAPEHVRSLLWERSAAPIAEGQDRDMTNILQQIDPIPPPQR